MTLAWYFKRLASMQPTEIVGRVQDQVRQKIWQVRPVAPPIQRPVAQRRLPTVPDDLSGAVDEQAAKGLLGQAEELLAGRWTMFGRPRVDVTADVDYYLDPVNDRRAPDSAYSFGIDHRNEAAVGNIKFVWELARHQHLTVLAAAYSVSGDERYAERIDRELRNYWAATPFLTGIHWTSGIELGLRLISWTWIRRLLDRWPGAPLLFEDNPVFVDQLGRHHQWLTAFGSHGSSANNHLIAEAVGQYVAASAFGLFDDSDRWRDDASSVLVRELDAQTFGDGLNRELAADYHGFVTEMALAAWVEAVLVDDPVAGRLAEPIGRALESLHALVDRAGQPHRQGDADDAHGLLVDPIGYDRWASLRRTASLLVEPAAWWHGASGMASSDIRTALFERCMPGANRSTNSVSERSRPRPSQFADAGLTILRDLEPGRTDEIWCIIDHGPHGFLSTAAHAHADALAVEIRHCGSALVVDPGTYCYHGERTWRDYFRSTVAHSTVEVGGENQSDIGGPFLWTRKAETSLRSSSGLTEGPVAEVTADHDGYRAHGLLHRRTVRLDRRARTVTLIDIMVDDPLAESAVDNSAVGLSLPLAPDVEVSLAPDGHEAQLSWAIADGPSGSGRATVNLDPQLSWSIACGQVSPPLGWYSAHFGSKQPAPVLIGRTAEAEPGATYKTCFQFPVLQAASRST